ncbi:MAG TPA: methylenetetrahydrofolate reductase [NAD(P)H] [Acetobacteraceae bacterium]|nr:methylenetetrahydrofolate reductase [NAD(P)H] [Acetobacteraceae bacterium]
MIHPPADPSGASTLARWLASPRIAGLPFRAGEFGPPKLSFEFFPPRTEALEQQLWSCVEKLEPLQPRFVSVTYGAGGSTRARTHATLVRLLKETRLTPAAHLTCVGASRSEVDEVARQYWEAGVRHIVALRGDPPPETTYAPHPQGYAFAADLVAGLRRVADFEISVAAYPEIHPQALGQAADLDNLKRKLDAGASRAITQFFFDATVYLRFLDRCLAAGITAPVVPGILPVTNFAQARRMAAMCGTAIPDWLAAMFEGTDEDPELRRMIAAIVVTDQVRLLQANGIDEFHIYTLNRPELTHAIAHILGVRPQPAAD